MLYSLVSFIGELCGATGFDTKAIFAKWRLVVGDANWYAAYSLTYRYICSDTHAYVPHAESVGVISI